MRRRALRGLKPYVWNSMAMVIPAVIISTFLGAINGYALTKWRFRGLRPDLRADAVSAPSFPSRWCSWPWRARSASSAWPAPCPVSFWFHTIYGWPFTTLFFSATSSSACQTASLQAAKMDGAGFFGIFFRLMLPMAPPAIVVTVIWRSPRSGTTSSSGSPSPSATRTRSPSRSINLVASSTGVKEYNVDMAAAIIRRRADVDRLRFRGKYFIRGLSAGSRERLIHGQGSPR